MCEILPRHQFTSYRPRTAGPAILAALLILEDPSQPEEGGWFRVSLASQEPQRIEFHLAELWAGQPEISRFMSNTIDRLAWVISPQDIDLGVEAFASEWTDLGQLLQAGRVILASPNGNKAECFKMLSQIGRVNPLVPDVNF